MMIMLKQYDSGQDVYINPKAILAITGLPASTCEITGIENGQRTRIDGASGMIWVVQETPEQIRELIEKVRR